MFKVKYFSLTKYISSKKHSETFCINTDVILYIWSNLLYDSIKVCAVYVIFNKTKLYLCAVNSINIQHKCFYQT